MTRRFAVAARELESAPRGVGRWLREVLRASAEIGRAKDLVLYTERDLAPGLDLPDVEVRTTGPGPGGGSTAWEQVALRRALARDRPAALLGPANALPVLTSVPGVLVLHDLSFEVLPEGFSTREGTRRRVLARLSARRARAVVAVSRFTAAEIQRLYGMGAPRVRVVPNGVSERFRPVADPGRLGEVRRAFGIAPSDDVVLSVGSFFTRRRIPDLVRGFAALLAERPSLRLVLVGDDRTHPPLDLPGVLRSSGAEARATWLPFVEEDDLLALLTIARVVVYLSDYEGFGLPPLEALACGTPVLSSATSALCENLEGRARLLGAHSAASVREGLRELLDTPPLPRVRPPFIDRLTWRLTAAGVLAALEEASA